VDRVSFCVGFNGLGERYWNHKCYKIGVADYLLFVDGQSAGVVEAK
jgi:type I site-specific restriction endonuclease